MIDEHVVKLGLEYLDQCASDGETATLVGMHWYIDGRNKTMPLTDEINEILRRRLDILVAREGKTVIFSANGKDRAVTPEDMTHADRQYRKEFNVAYARLRK